MTVQELMATLSQFPMDLPVFIYNGEPEPLEISGIQLGQVDGIWVDTACDGPLTGKEQTVLQIGIYS